MEMIWNIFHCRYRVLVAEDTNQTGRNFHLASIHFSTSKSDVYMRLTIFDYDQEIVRVEGKGSLVLPAILFMRTASNIPQSRPSSRPTSKTTGNDHLLAFSDYCVCKFRNA